MQEFGAQARTFLEKCAREDSAFDARQTWPGAYLAMQRAVACGGLSLAAWRVYDHAYQAQVRALGRRKEVA